MTIATTSAGWRRRAGLAAIVIAGVALPGAARAENLAQMLGLGNRVHMAQSQDQTAAQLIVQLQQLQEQVRTLTGQVEGLQFQVTQLQTLLQKQQADNEIRFQQLEGGARGKTSAVTQSGGAMPAGVSPQQPAQTQPAQDQQGALAPQGAVDMSATDGDTVPADSLGPSQDPLLGKGGEPGATANLGTIDSQDVTNLPDKPLDLSLTGQPRSSSDAEAQYNTGYQAVTRGDYAVATEQLKQFLSLYPDDPHAADATNWLGEALLQQRNYEDAAQVLVDGFKKFQDSPRAADILLKLGIALAGADEVPAACKTFAETERRYPNASPAFKKRLGEEMAKAKCPA